MLIEARKYLLAVGIFGWASFDKVSSPFFDNRPLEEHVAAIILASYYMQPRERVMVLVRKMNNLFPDRLVRSNIFPTDLDTALNNFAESMWTIVQVNFLDDEENFAYLVKNVVQHSFTQE